MAESPVDTQPLARPSRRCIAQAKAFLSYAEDVEIDGDAFEDILTGLPEEIYPSVASDGEQSCAEPNTSRNDNDPDEDEFAQEGQVFTSTLIIFWKGLFGRLSLAEDAWTEEEVKQIIQFLKHRGTRPNASIRDPSPLIPGSRDESFPYGVCDCAPDPDHPSPLRVWCIIG